MRVEAFSEGKDLDQPEANEDQFLVLPGLGYAVIDGVTDITGRTVEGMRTGRLAIPFELYLRSGRAYHFVCPKRRQGHPNVQAFRAWIKQEVGALDWGKCANRGVHWAPGD